MGKKNTTQTHAEILIIAVCVTMSQKKKKKKLTLTELVTCKFVILLHKYNVKWYPELAKQSWIK